MLTQNFFDKISFWPKIFSTQNFFDTKFFLAQIFFSQKFFDPKFFLAQKFFEPKNFFEACLNIEAKHSKYIKVVK